MPDSNSRYAAVGVHWADRPQSPEFLAVEGRLVLFDTAEIARQTLPRLGAGRSESWDASQETVHFTPAVAGGFNALSIFTGYDPYDVPNGFRAKGIYSEAKGLDWRRHVYWRHVLEPLVAWADGQAQLQEGGRS
jgi:hypothetical protein